MKITKTVLLVAFLIVAAACKPAKYADLESGLYADIETNRGDILIELYPEDTPLTVANFVSLAEGTNPNVSDSLKGKKYYDGLKFHRVIPDFMVQGGDPQGTGAGGPGYKFESEFPKDSLGRLIYKHDKAGVLSMANAGPGTNGSQFFITHKATPWLNEVHTIFGKVKYGMEVVDSIVANDVINHVKFIKIGHKATGFDAAKTFVNELSKSAVTKENRIKELAEKEKVRYAKFLEDKEVCQAKLNVGKATKMASGLLILPLKKGRGKRVNKKEEVSIHYTITLADGKQIQTTVGKDPFKFTMSKQPMIAGFTEGIMKMRVGGKTRLFIPYYLAYGENGGGPFPKKADIIFELEVLKVGK